MAVPLQGAIVLALYLAYRLCNNWRKLSHAPGPMLAGLTDLWRAWHQYNGRLRSELVRLHERHGPVVRYGVRSISISDPAVVDVVYGGRAGFTTADSYEVLVGISNGKEIRSLVSTADEARHAALRRSVAGAFTATNTLDYEPWVDATIADLVAVLSTRALVDLPEIMLYYSMDAAGRFSFGATLGCLAANADVGGVAQVIRDRLAHWGHWGALPGLERLVYRNWFAVRVKRAPSSMVALAFTKLRERTDHPDGPARAPDLLGRFIESSGTYPDILDTPGIVGMLMSIISGAGDTTASSTTAALYYLMKDAERLARLRAELSEAGIGRATPAYSQVAKLVYLNAVIKEAMRLFPVINGAIERKVPVGGASIAGVFIPEGTSVGCSPAALHLNPAVYGHDAQLFRPERWLSTDGEALRRMEAAHMGFSRGRRVCIGQHIATMQMKKALAVLMMNFDMALSDPKSTLDADFSPQVTQTLLSMIMSSTAVMLEEPKHTIRLPSGQTVTIQSETSIDADEIPIIDVSAIWSDDLEAKQAVAEQVREACSRIGFFYAQHPGIDPEYARRAFEQGKRFCDLPMEKKLEVDTARVPNEYVGYHKMQGYNRNGRKQQGRPTLTPADLSEAFNWAYDAAYDPEAIDTTEPSLSIWPSDLPGFKEGMYAYHTQLLQFARRLTKIFALALHMPEDFFDEYVKQPEAGMRIIHYPEQDASATDQNGIGAHTDFECFTVVTLDGNEGLEVLSKGGYWVKAKIVPDAFVVNVADCFMRQTNDFFVSTVHRVVNRSGRDRYSLPFFFG
ncbi:hypothetical protein LTR53_005416 [Teratosphaeriaceae sp. CCFEE 6253]|nr:hypothetical protein LTR53_005416 [Teratosphaeriaceae sp. CCFEE 6253]